MQTRYFISTRQGIRDVPDSLWDKPVMVGVDKAHPSLTFRGYFKALNHFIIHHLRPLLSILFEETSCDLSIEAPSRAAGTLDIISEKCGSFYQVARCIISLSHCPSKEFCLLTGNRQGECLIQDFKNLCHLKRKLKRDFVPTPFLIGYSKLLPDPEGHRLVCAALEWLSGFWEWHLKDPLTVEVWTPEIGTKLLNTTQFSQLFYSISQCLALSFEPANLKHIWLWHNSAGDFILKVVDSNKLDVKLTTVRYYDSPWYHQGEIGGSHEDKLLISLLYFLLDTCLNIRIDRREGTGHYIFAAGQVLDWSLSGFFSGLNTLAQEGKLPTELPFTLMALLRELDPDELYSLYTGILQHYVEAKRTDVDFIMKNLSTHCQELAISIGQWTSRCTGTNLTLL